MAYIRKVKTASGATAVQVAYIAYSKIIRIDHIGSAHNPAELELLNELAKVRLAAGQTSLLDPTLNTSILLKQSVSDVPYVKLLRTVRSGVVLIDGKEYPAKAALPEDVDKLLQKLERTH